MEKQFGYPEKYCTRFREMDDGMETKRQIPFTPNGVPGDTVIGASKSRPILALDLAIDIIVKNLPNVETAVGSGLYMNDRLFARITATDGDDLLVNLVRDSESAVQDTFFRESSVDTFDDILQTAEDRKTEHLLIPCYSEIPVTVSLVFGDLALEYTGGTITFGAAVVDVGVVYGEGRLGFEQPFIYQHSDEMGEGRNALISLKSRKPFFGVLLVHNSYARAEAENINFGTTFADMKDDSNETNYLLGVRNAARLWRAVPDSVELLTDDKGHMNTDTAEVAVTVAEGLSTTLKYVGIFSSLPGETARKGNRPVLTATT